ncbi:hypothetical protein PCASD_08614 [Puccinia coronata f. sp. avenae]|uniref:Uncharacterized protein n=1 Tax=Puccinia coronata f. sp. avenae TaxID=200324 RepID=A0A2N5UBX6_9BASI|nr:hypothetical protein PCASD_08614 [Puccinia coronata f. sp. avenae]
MSSRTFLIVMMLFIIQLVQLLKSQPTKMESSIEKRGVGDGHSTSAGQHQCGTNDLPLWREAEKLETMQPDISSY